MFEQRVESDAGPDWGEGEIDDIVECERIIWSTQARQAKSIVDLFEKRLELVRKTHRLEDSQIAQSVIGEVAMARKVAASTAANQFGFALGLKRLPSTQALFTAGAISERVARAVTNETAGLTAADIQTIDDQLAVKLPTLTAKRAAAAARKLAIGLDPHGAQHATNVARSERHISIHALPHSMASIRMNLPVEQAAALYQALDDYAQGLKYEGDPRTGSQIMSDTAVERITGQSNAGDIAVEIGLLMTPGALLADEDIPALLAGYGPLPAAIGRQLATGSKAWLRRLFTDPVSGDLTARDKTRRRFDGPLGDFVRERDQHCGRPWCDCQIRDLDHIDPYNGTNTTADNAQGLCKRSHTTKHLPRWRVEATKSGSIWTTPTGHRYDTARPRLGGDGPKMGKPKILDDESAMEHKLRKTIGRATLHRRQ